MGDLQDPQLDFTRMVQPAKPPADADQRTATPGSAGLDAFHRAVEQAERDVAGISGDALHHSFAPPARLISGIAAAIATDLERAHDLLSRAPADPLAINPLADRLDKAIEMLSSLAKHERLPMRETELEYVFDLEDEIRVNLLHIPRLSRAEKYYDENLIPVTHDTQATQDAASIEQGLQGGANAPAQTRDELIDAIKLMGRDIGNALQDGFRQATSAINEPAAPEQPALLEQLAELAVGVLAGEAAAVMGELVGKAISLAESHTGREEGLGHIFKDGVIDAFKDDAKDKTKGVFAPKKAGEAPQPEGAEKGAEPTPASKGAYLLAAQARTDAAELAAWKRFELAGSSLKRVPSDTLKAVSGAFSTKTQGEITDRYRRLVINEWVNYGKQAADHGEDVTLGAKLRDGSKLDTLTPSCTLRVLVYVDDAGTPALEDAQLAGVTKAVLDAIQKEDESLGSVHLHRAVDIVFPDARAHINLSPSGGLPGGPLSLRTEERRGWARLSKHQLGAQISDGDVFAGMNALIRWLNTIGCDRIRG